MTTQEDITAKHRILRSLHLTALFNIGSGSAGPPVEAAGHVDPSPGIDIGLLVLRATLACIVGAHGLQKLFGLFGGSGIGGFAKVLGGYGFTSNTTLLAWVTALSETGGSALLLLGLGTPLGAAALLGVAVNIVYIKAPTGFFMGTQKDGFEFQLLLGAVALAYLFTGAGRYSFDARTLWGRRPVPYGLAGLALALATSMGVILLFR
ncbi:DoxX family protein [Nonomuraea sp. NPDC050022]|uniref:DoxX family protein n=1 Tax=Nonomuraea sp. NPDC050022 TaxID=3364358 RepID=UPI00379FD091